MRKTIIYTLFPKKQEFFLKKCIFPAKKGANMLSFAAACPLSPAALSGNNIYPAAQSSMICGASYDSRRILSDFDQPYVPDGLLPCFGLPHDFGGLPMLGQQLNFGGLPMLGQQLNFGIPPSSFS